MIRKNIYKWHRICSLIIALPVVLWAVSGFMHPLMTNIKPAIATQSFAAPPTDTARLLVALPDALKKNNIQQINNVRIVQIGANSFYQLQLPGKPVLTYISTQTGGLLKNGDELYARYLAKHFLTGKGMAGPAADEPEYIPTHDCCINATAAIMKDTSGAPVRSVDMVKQYTSEYKYVNRLLPVYKVAFDRGDGIRIYVETMQDRFAFAMDDRRAGFDTFFRLFHTLGWLDFMGRGKHVVELAIMLLAFLTTCMGIYIFCITKTKKKPGHALVKARNYHRWTSIIISLFTLMFTFSGGFHALEKIKDADKANRYIPPIFNAAATNPDIHKIYRIIDTGSCITNISLVQMDGQQYWQVFNKPVVPAGAKPQTGVAVPTTAYIHARSYTLLPDGEKQYAGWLAAQYRGNNKEPVIAIEPITKFEDEYGFVNKRLPVWRVRYTTNNNERFYIETSTAKLAAHVTDKDLVEGYSFALLHKHHFMDFAGKTGRDISTMVWAAAQVLVVAVGLALFFKMRRKRQIRM